MKKQIKLMLMTGMMVIVASGCKKTKIEPEEKIEQNTSITEEQEQQEDSNTQEESSAVTPSIMEQTEETPAVTLCNEAEGLDYHKNIKKCGDLIFYSSRQGIYVTNVKTNATTVLCEAKAGRSIDSFCVNQDMIYYIESTNDGASYTCNLYSVSVDGAQAALELENLAGGTTVSVYENVLYLYSYDTFSCYEILEDKKVGEQLDNHETYYRFLENLNAGESWYSQLPTLGESLNRYHAIWTTDEEGALWNIDITTGEMKEYKNSNQTIVTVQEPYAITMAYEEDQYQFYLWNLETKENTKWFSGQEYYLDSDENGAYFGVQVDGENPVTKYEYFTWDGQKTELFEAPQVDGMRDETATGVTNFSLIDGTIYYQYGENGKMYLMARELRQINTVIRLGEAYLDKNYESYGHVERDAYAVPFTEDTSKTLINIAYEQFVFDGDTDATKKINQTLTEIKNANVTSNINQAKQDEEYLQEEEGIETYSYTSSIDEITKLSDRYISLAVSEYIFCGGAHGMPIRNYYLFDLTTGDRLFLEDVVSESEDEIHAIVASYFQEMYNKAPDAFWPESVETVKSSAGYHDMFYLTKDQIVFYFAPYDLAAFAYGFVDVSVPMSEFNLKIELN